jgi:hypothetical protein
MMKSTSAEPTPGGTLACLVAAGTTSEPAFSSTFNRSVKGRLPLTGKTLTPEIILVEEAR